MEANRRWNIEHHQRDVHCVVSPERAYPHWEQPGWDYTRPDSYSWWYFCYQAQGLALAGAICAIVPPHPWGFLIWTPVLGILAVVFVVSSKSEFSRASRGEFSR